MTDRDFLMWLGKWCRIYEERARDDGDNSARRALGDVATLVSNHLQENPTGKLTPGPTRKVE